MLGRAHFDPSERRGPQLLRLDQGDDELLIPLNQVQEINANHLVSGAVRGGLLATLAGAVVGGTPSAAFTACW